MLLEPKLLIDRSIADLTQLSAVLAAETGGDGPPQSPELKACEEVVATINTLILRLRMARNARIAPLGAKRCLTCDD